MLDAFEAPYMQRALVEILLLAVLAGVLGTWIVLRRLAFFTHGVGTATFPGLVVAGPWGVAPQLAALAAALVLRGRGRAAARTRRMATDAATGLLLVGALALGVVLASDVYESGAGVDRLLFGSLIGLSDRDLWLTAGAGRRGARVLDAALRRARGWRRASTPAARARARRPRRRSPTGCCWLAVAAAAVVALDAVGALLVTVVLVVPAATVRLLAPSVRALQARHRARWPRSRASPALWLADALNVGPGPAIAVLGGARVRVVRGGGCDERVARGPRRRLRARRATCSRRRLRARAGQIAAVLGPNGGGKTTLFRALLGELPFRRGSGRARRAGPAYVPQTDRARLDFPVSALDVALMGAYGRTPWLRRVARADRDAARGGARPRRPRRPRRASASARSPAASASAC